ncbi:MAG: choice-of-anchor V domain-containing protein [Acidobacteriota bacterium]
MNHRVLLALLFCVSSSGALWANEAGPITNRTGSVIFGEANCTQCHSSFAANSGPGRVRLLGLPENYTPGQNYDLTVTVEQQGQSRWGFQLSSRSGNSEADEAQAGTLTPKDGNTKITLDPKGIQFISHTDAGTRMGTLNGPVAFEFRWQAPAGSLGPITFSLAGNAANGNDLPSGDYIYLLEMQVPPSQGLATISGVTPSSGPVTGGTPVIISGSGFEPGASVSVGGVAATEVIVVSGSQINAVVPQAMAAGTADIVVTNPASPSVTLAGGFRYTHQITAAPSSNAIILPFVIDTAAFRCNLGISNLTDQAGNATISLVDASGTVVGTREETIPASGLRQVNGIIPAIVGQGSPTNLLGYLIVETSRPASAFATPIDNVTQDSSVIQGTRGTASHLLLPTSTSTGLFRTTLTLINDGPAANHAELRLRNAEGVVQAVRPVPLAPFGFFHTDDVHAFLGASGTFGPIEIVSTDAAPLPLIAVSRVYAALVTNAGAGTASSFFRAEPYSW